MYTTSVRLNARQKLLQREYQSSYYKHRCIQQRILSSVNSRNNSTLNGPKTITDLSLSRFAKEPHTKNLDYFSTNTSSSEPTTKQSYETKSQYTTQRHREIYDSSYRFRRVQHGTVVRPPFQAIGRLQCFTTSRDIYASCMSRSVNEQLRRNLTTNKDITSSTYTSASDTSKSSDKVESNADNTIDDKMSTSPSMPKRRIRKLEPANIPKSTIATTMASTNTTDRDDDTADQTTTTALESLSTLSRTPSQRSTLSSSISPSDASPSSSELPLEQLKQEQVKISQQARLRKESARLQTQSNVYRALAGNVAICVAKLAAYSSSGSSAMWSEFIHSVVDCGNQALLLVGLRDSLLVADRKHPYGYGKSVYFYALVSALGTFFLGAGVSMTHAVQQLTDPSIQAEAISYEVWSVLVASFLIDGYVFTKTLTEISESKPVHLSFWQHLRQLRDPATLAILLEDGAACLGIIMALGGIVATHVTQMPVYDAMAGVGISTLLGIMGLTLVRVNHRFLLGQAVDRDMIEEIEAILLNRRSIDNIRSVQSQWTGPETFSFKAEVDFDGTYLAAKLMPMYKDEFVKIRDSMDNELQVLLALYAEDVMRTAEREVRYVEYLIRKKYPGAEYIELEPMSVDVDKYALDDNLLAELRRAEGEMLNTYLRSLKKEENVTSKDSLSTKTDQRTASTSFDKQKEGW